MGKINLFFKSSMNCNLFCDNTHIATIEANKSTLIKTSLEEFNYIDVFPVSNRNDIYFIPFKFKPNKLNCGENVKIIDLLNNNYLAEINPKKICKNIILGKKIFETKLSNISINVICDNVCNILIESEQQKINYTPKHLLFDVVCQCVNLEGKDYFVLNAKTDQDKIYVFVCPVTNPDKCWQKVCDKIDFSLPTFYTLNNIDDFAHHCIITKYKITDYGIVIIEKFSSYNNSTNFEYLSPDNIVDNFLNCIKVQDFKLARKFLNNELTLSLTNTHLKNFFNKFDTFYKCPDSPNTYVLIGQEIYYYTFEIQDSQIVNINQM